MRPLLLLCALALACAAPGASPAPVRAPDIQKGKIDIVFSGLVQSSYYRPSGRDLLTAALDAIRAEARRSGGSGDVRTPEFDGSQDAFIADFRRFAATAEELAAKNPQLAPSRIAEVAIQAMLNVNPDCHNYYVPARRGERVAGVAAPLSQNRLQFRMLPGGIAHLTWREFDLPVADDVKKALDQLLAEGARAWLFDVRNNRGGTGAQVMVSWFVNGGPIWREVDHDGKKTPVTAKTEFFLPERYQLPIAVLIDGATYSDAEFFTLGLQARGRAKVFGTKSGGCLGGVLPVTLPDGSAVGIVDSIALGPFSDAPINNVGLAPDVEVRTGDPIDAAAQYLRSLTR